MIDAAIPLQVNQPKQPENALAGLAQIAQIKSATLQNALVTQEIQQRAVQAQQAQYQQSQLIAGNKALQASNGDYEKAGDQLIAGGYGELGTQFKTNALTYKQNQLKAEKETTDYLQSQQKQLADTMLPAINSGDPAQAIAALTHASNLPGYAGMIAKQFSQTTGGDLAKMKQLAQQYEGQQAIAKQAETESSTFKNTQQGNQAAAATANDKAKLPQIQAEAGVATRAQTAAQLAAAGPQGYAAAIANLPADQQAGWPATYDKLQILRAAETPTQAIADTQKQTELGQNQQRINIERANSARADKEFIAKFGTPETRAAFTASVIKDPDSFFSLPPDIRPGVAADLVYQGKTVPVQLPSELKTRAVSAGLALQAVQQIRTLLQDPEVQKSVGAWAGRLGNVENAVGDTMAGQSPELAAKEQQFRTQLALLKFQEAKGVIGGSRIAGNLMDQFSKAAPKNTEAVPLLNGALNGVESNLKNVEKETRAYSSGGAQGGSTGGVGTPIKRFNPATGKVETVNQ